MNTLEIFISNEEYGYEPYINATHLENGCSDCGTFFEGFQPTYCICPNCGQKFDLVKIINKNRDNGYLKHFKNKFDEESIPIEVTDEPEDSVSVFSWLNK